MTYIAHWTVARENTGDAIARYEEILRGKIPGVKSSLYMYADTSGDHWRGIAILEVPEPRAITELLVLFAGFVQAEILAGVSESDALAVWREFVKTGA